MKVHIDFDPSAQPGERRAIEARMLPMRVHGVTVDMVCERGPAGGNPILSVEGEDDVVLALLTRAGYHEGEWEVIYNGGSQA